MSKSGNLIFFIPVYITKRLKMKLISRIEELILVSIWRLQDQAYGLAIMEEVARASGKTWLTGSIYVSLSRLLKQGLVEAVEGEPTAERGGRRKIYYRMKPAGQTALQEIRQVHNALWAGLPPFKNEEKG
jgi:PadR family transcriptional regulator PadR